MQIAVLGCGAMGSIYAGLLAASGHKVIVIDTYEAHVAAINDHGLRVSGASGDRIFKVDAYTKPPDIQVDLLIVALKAVHVASAAVAKMMVTAESSILTIQNGLGSADTVADIFGPERLIVGVAQGFGAALIEPGHSYHNDMKAIRMGAFSAASTVDVTSVVDAYRQAGFDAEAVSDIIAMQWEKLICNVAYSALSALSGKTVGEVMDDQLLGPVSRAAAVEAWETARLRDIAISVVDPVAHVKDFASRMRDAKPSVLLDIEAGRMSEISVINGAIEREAVKAGGLAPVNSTLTALVQFRESQMAK